MSLFDAGAQNAFYGFSVHHVDINDIHSREKCWTDRLSHVL